jgi:hypothetical protein
VLVVVDARFMVDLMYDGNLICCVVVFVAVVCGGVVVVVAVCGFCDS